MLITSFEEPGKCGGMLLLKQLLLLQKSTVLIFFVGLCLWGFCLVWVFLLLFSHLSDMFAAGRRKFCGCYGVLLNQKSCILPWFCSSLPLQAWSPADSLYLAIWEQQHGELELVSARKDSQSAILSLLFTTCQAPEKHLHVQCGESVSKDGAGSPG